MPPGDLKLLVTHHPLFALPVSDEGILGRPIGRQELALDVLQQEIAAASFQELQAIFKYLIRAESLIKQSAYPRFTLEMALLQAPQMRSFEAFDSVLQTVNALGEKFAAFKTFAPQPPIVSNTPPTPESTPDILRHALEIFRGTPIASTAQAPQ